MWSSGLLITFEVHESQAGKLRRDLSVVETSLAEIAIVIDADTAVVEPTSEERFKTLGADHAWVVARDRKTRTVILKYGTERGVSYWPTTSTDVQTRLFTCV